LPERDLHVASTQPQPLIRREPPRSREGIVGAGVEIEGTGGVHGRSHAVELDPRDEVRLERDAQTLGFGVAAAAGAHEPETGHDEEERHLPTSHPNMLRFTRSPPR
jgi:hypothetical protein